MLLLCGERRVLVNLFILIHIALVNLLKLLGVAEPGVEHALIIPDESHLTIKALVPVVL